MLRTGVVVAPPWSKAWQPWGATQSTGLRPEQKEDLAIACQLWHPGKPHAMPGSYSSQPMALILHQRKNTPRGKSTPLPHFPAPGTLTGLSWIHSQEKWRQEHIGCCTPVMLCLPVKVAFYRRRNRAPTFRVPSGELCHSCWVNQKVFNSGVIRSMVCRKKMDWWRKRLKKPTEKWPGWQSIGKWW